MPKYRSNFQLQPPRSAFPAGFEEARAAFRENDLDLFCQSVIRFVARADGESVAVFRSIADARAWLAAQPAQTPARRAL